MGRAPNGRFDALFISHAPVERDIVWGAVVKCLAAGRDIDLGGQIVDLGKNGFGGVLCLFAGLCDDHGDRLADKTDLAFGQYVTVCRRTLGAVTVRHQRTAHDEVYAHRLEILDREGQSDAGHLPNLGQIDRAQSAMRNLTANENGVQRSLWRDVVDVSALPRDETPVLEPANRLRLAELVHERLRCLLRGSLAGEAPVSTLRQVFRP